MAEAFIGRHTLERVPLKAAANQIDELSVRRLSQFLHDVLQAVLFFTLGDNLKRGWHGCVIIFELFEQVLASGPR